MKGTFFRYFVVGITTVLIDFSLLQILTVLGLDKVFANVISVLVSVVFNFLMQNSWSFKAGSSNKLQKSLKYLFLTIFNYIVNTYGFFLLYKEFDFDTFLFSKISFLPDFLPEGFYAKIVITGMIMCWNFFLFKYWVFKVKNNQVDEL